jgi:hypothetical protein
LVSRLLSGFSTDRRISAALPFAYGAAGVEKWRHGSGGAVVPVRTM